MSWTTITSKIVKIRKPHKCFACNDKIEPPAEMNYNFSVDGGDTSSTYMCMICDEFMTPERWRDYDYEMNEGDIWQDMDYEAFRKSKITSTELTLKQ